MSISILGFGPCGFGLACYMALLSGSYKGKRWKAEAGKIFQKHERVMKVIFLLAIEILRKNISEARMGHEGDLPSRYWDPLVWFPLWFAHACGSTSLWAMGGVSGISMGFGGICQHRCISAVCWWLYSRCTMTARIWSGVLSGESVLLSEHASSAGWGRLIQCSVLLCWSWAPVISLHASLICGDSQRRHWKC